MHILMLLDHEEIFIYSHYYNRFIVRREESLVTKVFYLSEEHSLSTTNFNFLVKSN